MKYDKRYLIIIVSISVVIVGVLVSAPIKIKKILINAIHEQYGAKAFIESLHFHYFPFGIEINTLKVEDNKQIASHKIKIDTIMCWISIRDLIQKRLMISELFIDGMIIEKSRKKPEEFEEDSLDSKARDSASKKEGEGRYLIDLSKLTLLSASYAINKTYPSLNQDLASLSDIVAEESDLNQLELDLIKTIKLQESSATESIKNKIENITKLMSKTVSVNNQLQLKKRKLTALTQTHKAHINQLNDAAEYDYNYIIKALSKETYKEGSISNTLMQPYVAKVVKMIVGLTDYIGEIRSLQNDTANELVTEKPRLLIEKAHISGQHEGRFFTVKVTQLSSNPIFTNQPTTIHITSPDNDPSPFTIVASLGYQNAMINHDISLSIDQIDILKLMLYQSGKNKLALDNAQLNLKATLKQNGDRLAGHADVKTSDVSYDKGNMSAAFSLPYLLYQTLKKIKNPSFSATISGTQPQPKVVITSPIDKQFSGIVRLVARKQLESKKEAVKAEIDRILEQEKNKLVSQLPTEDVLSQLDDVIQRSLTLKEAIILETPVILEEKVSN